MNLSPRPLDQHVSKDAYFIAQHLFPAPLAILRNLRAISAEAPAKRLQHHAKLAEHTLSDRPTIYLWRNKWLYAMGKKLAGFTP